MNLLNTSTLELLWLDESESASLHAALSRCWDSGEILHDGQQSSSECEPKLGYSRLIGACVDAFGSRKLDWVCADAPSSVLLADSINVFYQWCSSCSIRLAYPDDMCASDPEEILAESSWIQRSWAHSMSIEKAIFWATQSPVRRIEDAAYSLLLGVLDVSMQIVYAEEESMDLCVQNKLPVTLGEATSDYSHDSYAKSWRLPITGVSLAAPTPTCRLAPSGQEDGLCMTASGFPDQSFWNGSLGVGLRIWRGSLARANSEQPFDVSGHDSSETPVLPTRQDVDSRASSMIAPAAKNDHLCLSDNAQSECDAISTSSTLEDDGSDETGDYEDCLFSSSAWDDQATELDPLFSELTGALAQTALDGFSGWLADCSSFQEQPQSIDSCHNNKRIKSRDVHSHAKAGLVDDGDHEIMETPGSKRWACPFYLHGIAQDTQCLTRTDLRTIRDLKQHLCLNHRQPYYCPTCGTTFPRASARDRHITARTCSLEEWKGAPQGLSHDQLQRLARRCSPGTSEINQWYDIWNIIHSGDGVSSPRKEPLTPYSTGMLESAVCLVRDFWSQRGRLVIADFLEQRGLQGYEIPDEERNLAALYQVTLNHIVDQVARTMSTRDENPHVDPSSTIGKVLSSIREICSRTRLY